MLWKKIIESLGKIHLLLERFYKCFWNELIDVLIYFIGRDYQNELLGLINWCVDLFYR